MESNGVLLAVEDRLSDAIATKILKNLGFEIVKTIGYRGNNYLKQKAKGLNRNAKKPYDVFMLTDLDSPKICPPQLIQCWVGDSLNPGFFLRVAVMEVESWVMADQSAISEFLKIPIKDIPSNTDNIPQPKEFLLSLAWKSKPTTLRKDLVIRKGRQPLKRGPGYNERLSEFVRDYWNLNRAASVSPSLKRTIERLQKAESIPYND